MSIIYQKKRRRKKKSEYVSSIIRVKLQLNLTQKDAKGIDCVET